MRKSKVKRIRKLIPQEQKSKALILDARRLTLDANQGFTFIEIILYIAIVSIMLSSLIPFAWNVIGGSVKSATQQEVYAQGRFISERISYEIRNAKSINSVAATSLSLQETSAGVNPTIIDLSGGKIRITQGAGAAVPLNSNDTTISALQFTDFSNSPTFTTRNVQFSFTLDSSIGQTRQEYKKSITMEGSAELRSN